MDRTAQLTPLVEQASAILDAAVPRFLDGHRADSAVRKKGNDFATEVDLAIERQVVEALVAATGIGVHGEEFGGAPVDTPWVWVLIRWTARSTTPQGRRWPRSCWVCCTTAIRWPA
ncbi:hypothetical protein NIIDMKKI_39750 [Mycobacterium kansasii]|uniref:Uncharacterized protein n=1 Tax=Mycobacterium kansasii TaxID=1768 RepID=A0A7G1IGJ3_MYCKA|nr:hypothetical protein NIIDMKKI_39750 [Mycobacterium kansasii]